MKNKTKKILAGACLGLVGLGCMTGCSMSKEQKAALDLITQKSDEIVNLLEHNLEYNNKNLSKEEAAEKILLGRNKFKFISFDQVEISMLQNEYLGIFDKLDNPYTSDENTPWRMLFRMSGDVKLFAGLEGDVLEEIMISDFSNDEHLEWDKGENAFSSLEYNKNIFVLDHFDKFLTEYVAPVITKEHIKDIITTENGYEFIIFSTSAEGHDCESKLYVSFDGYITKWELKAIHIDDRIDEPNTSVYVEFNFKYNEDVDFSVVDAKLSELKS